MYPLSNIGYRTQPTRAMWENSHFSCSPYERMFSNPKVVNVVIFLFLCVILFILVVLLYAVIKEKIHNRLSHNAVQCSSAHQTPSMHSPPPSYDEVVSISVIKVTTDTNDLNLPTYEQATRYSLQLRWASWFRSFHWCGTANVSSSGHMVLIATTKNYLI